MKTETICFSFSEPQHSGMSNSPCLEDGDSEDEDSDNQEAAHSDAENDDRTNETVCKNKITARK